MDESLVTKTYIVSNYPTSADVALYGRLHHIYVSYTASCNVFFHLKTSVQSSLSPKEYYAYPSLTRYFDHIQNLPAVKASAHSLSPPAFSLIPIDIESAPKLERKADPPKKKKDPKPPAADIPATTSNVAASASTAAAKVAEKAKDTAAAAVEAGVDAKGKVNKKKDKKEAAASDAGGKKKGGPTAEEAGEPAPSMIDLRVGLIVDGNELLSPQTTLAYGYSQSRSTLTPTACT